MREFDFHWESTFLELSLISHRAGVSCDLRLVRNQMYRQGAGHLDLVLLTGVDVILQRMVSHAPPTITVVLQ